jgi:hypothetical protein
MNEAETRAEHIDPALEAAGWGVVPGSRIRREYAITLGRIEGTGGRANAFGVKTEGVGPWQYRECGFAPDRSLTVAAPMVKCVHRRRV